MEETDIYNVLARQSQAPYEACRVAIQRISQTAQIYISQQDLAYHLSAAIELKSMCDPLLLKFRRQVQAAEREMQCVTMK